MKITRDFSIKQASIYNKEVAGETSRNFGMYRLADGDRIYIACLKKDKIIGGCYIKIDNDELWLYNLYVLTKYRGKGIATHLLNYITSRYYGVYLHVLKADEKATSLYRHYGCKLINVTATGRTFTLPFTPSK